jgi:hypothetical protein
MIELDMVYVSYFGDFLSKAVENLSNKIFCLGLARQEKPPGRPETPAGPARPPLAQAFKMEGPAGPLRNIVNV